MRTRSSAVTLAMLVVHAAGTPWASLAGAQPAQVPGATSTSPRIKEGAELELTTTRVIIYKDGHAMIVKRGVAIPDTSGRVHTYAVPDAAVLGCFWASRENGDVLGMRAEWVESSTTREDQVPCASVLDLLRANVGRSVEIELVGDKGRTISGTIKSALLSPPKSEPDRLNDADVTSPAPNEPLRVEQPVWAGGGQFVEIRRSADSTMVLPVADIRNVSGAELTTTITRTVNTKEKRKRLTIDVGDSTQPVAVTLMYFTPGIRWIPTYRVGLPESGDSAALALQGEILNELEDIENAPVDLVVGVPNFRFKDVVSPLSLERTLRDTLAVAAPNVMGRQTALSNAMFAQRAGEWRQRDGATAGQPDDSAQLGMTGEQDMFVYSVPTMTLGKGDRATLPLWTQPAKHTHLYTFDVDVVRDPQRQQTYYSPRRPGGQPWQPPTDRDSPVDLSANEVWHQIELMNASQTPWTTGAALVMGGTKAIPIAQELLTYTPIGGKTLLPLTVAVDIRGKFDEEEISRRDVEFGGNTYKLIRVKGTATLTSSRAEASEVRIRVDNGGRALSASDGGKIAIKPHRPEDWGGYRWDYRLNPHSQTTWTFTLKPGESKTVTLEYEYHWRP